MNGLSLKTLFVVMLIGLSSCGSTNVAPQADSSGLAPLDDFDKALGLYAQGLLVFEDDTSQGLKLLVQAMELAPYQRQIVDDFYLYARKHVSSVSQLDPQVSDYDTLQTTLIRHMSVALKKHPGATYLRRRLIESLIALDRYGEAELLLKGQDHTSDATLYLAWLRYLRATNGAELAAELQQIFAREKLNHNVDLHLTAIGYLLELGARGHQYQLLEHSKKIIHNLPSLPPQFNRSVTMTLLDGILFGSDIGEGARRQIMYEVDYTDVTAQWSLLAGVLMKLNMHEEAYLVIKHRVLKHTASPWQAAVNAALCCHKMGDEKRRIAYLEQAFTLKPDHSYTQRSLLLALTANGDSARALEVYEKIADEHDFWLQKIRFYILKDLEQFHTAFSLAERLFTWPDSAAKITGMTPSFAAAIVPVYLKMGRLQLLEERVNQCRRYLPGNVSLLNALAYSYAVAAYKLDQAEKWIIEVYAKGQVISSYADTYAWICYQQGRYKEARRHIDWAMAQGVKVSAEILLHAGDIYSKLGHDKAAVEFWQQALAQESGYKDELKTRLQQAQ